MSELKRTLLAPRETKDDEYAWRGLEVKASPGRGQGLFATRDLPANTQIPYYGKRISERAFLKLWQKSKAPRKHHLVAYLGSYHGERLGAVDGHPRHSPSKQGVALRGLAIASKINEPSPGEVENAWLMEVKVPGDPRQWPGMVLMRTVRKGEEILTHHGPDYRRSYKVGRILKKEPAWFLRAPGSVKMY